MTAEGKREWKVEAKEGMEGRREMGEGDGRKE